MNHLSFSSKLKKLCWYFTHHAWHLGSWRPLRFNEHMRASVLISKAFEDSDLTKASKELGDENFEQSIAFDIVFLPFWGYFFFNM